ncbi:MAG: ABC transporter permease [Desulfobacterota bacterium]|jgi:peptide/nickel transport system permease protein|nr:ABC transporter permease [Thermodesulfobacteriota bacterium]
MNGSEKKRPRSRALRRFYRNPLSLLGLFLVVVLTLTAVLAPLLAPKDPAAQSLFDKRAKPFGKFLLGADQFGRDILSRLIYGARVSLFVAFFSVAIALSGGLIIGTLCGYFEGALDTLLMRVMDILLSFPYLLLAIALVSALGPGLLNTTVAIGFWALPTFARMVRASVLGLKKREFVTAASALGAPAWRIILLHIVPNFVAPVVVYATLFMANAIMMEAALSFLGLGVQPPTPSWGEMISSGRNALMVAPHVATIPGLAIMLAVLGFNLLGDGLRDALDPKMKVP